MDIRFSPVNGSEHLKFNSGVKTLRSAPGGAITIPVVGGRKLVVEVFYQGRLTDARAIVTAKADLDYADFDGGERTVSTLGLPKGKPGLVPGHHYFMAFRATAPAERVFWQVRVTAFSDNPDIEPGDINVLVRAWANRAVPVPAPAAEPEQVYVKDVLTDQKPVNPGKPRHTYEEPPHAF